MLCNCTLDEVKVFRDLEEAAYYKMNLPEEDEYNKCNYHKSKSKPKQKHRLPQYYRKQIDGIKLDRLENPGWWLVSNEKPYKRRCYYSGRKKMAKKRTNKKIRHYKGEIGNNGSYRKLYDYWCDIF